MNEGVYGSLLGETMGPFYELGDGTATITLNQGVYCSKP